MRIVLTGGSGFIGGELLKRKVLDAEFITVGRAPPASPVACHVEVDFAVPGALEQAIWQGRLPDQADVVMLLGTSRLHRSFPESAPDMFQVNVAATAAFLDYARRAGVRQVVLGSSGTVYHPFPKLRHGEDDISRPESYFGWSKLAAEDLAALYAPHIFSLFVPRFFVPYGPGQQGRMVDGIIGRVRRGEAVRLPPQGGGLVSAPIYLDDVLDVLRRAVSESWSGRYNVAGPEDLSLAEMATIIGRVLGREPVIERGPDANNSAILPDLTRLRSMIDVDSFVTFEDGIRRIVKTG